MKRILFNRRNLIAAGTAALLAGCQVVPSSGPVSTGPEVNNTPEPDATVLPTDETRHRIALLVPLSGQNGEVGQSIANATTMAILDTNADNLRITTYDTSKGARVAAAKALADGNRLILGPLLSQNVNDVSSVTASTNVPLISFSNDTGVAGANVFVMGHIPEQSINRTVAYARTLGASRFGALFPNGNYGNRARSALDNALANYGGLLAGSERYNRSNQAIIGAAQRLGEKGEYDAVLIADSARLSTVASGELRKEDGSNTRILGTELWSGENAVTRASALRGALFSAVSNQRFRRFSDSYESRFGGKPYRIATLGYDAVLLTLRVARDWRVGSRFPTSQLRDSGGFLGLDGAFRFGRSGVVERAMEVREVGDGTINTVSAAPTRFND